MKSHHRQWNPEKTDLTEVSPAFPLQKSTLKRSENRRHSAVWSIIYWYCWLSSSVRLVATFFIRNLLPPTTKAVEQDLGMYSNIRIFQLVDSQLSLQDKEKLNQRLKDTFYMINKQVKSKNMHISVYYFVSLRRLDFNFSVESQCENKQLGMTIYRGGRVNNYSII